MKASIVIPVWNGASVINDCLQALYTLCHEDLFEVICVDNASSDRSGEQITSAFPQARLLPQAVNLGFAGGVNAGIDAAQGDVLILLNQDCIVEPGWMNALKQALHTYPQYGILGCKIYRADGSLDHAGAAIRRPDAMGIHLTENDWDGVRQEEYVTGAALALRRSTWETTGRFDEGFYPAYFEDADYCYRARRLGILTALAPDARVKHLFSSRNWQEDPNRHAANQHTMRYRFVCKHFPPQELPAFFAAEISILESIQYLNHALGRLIAARHTLNNLPDILQRRKLDLGDTIPGNAYRQLQVGFAQIMHNAFRLVEKMILPPLANSLQTEFGFQDASLVMEGWLAQIGELSNKEHELMARIHFHSPSEPVPASVLRRLYRLVFKRIPGWLSGREERLQTELYNVRIERVNQLQRVEYALYERLKMLEILTEYEHPYQ
jgi:GT2 family glycosyltransferase